MIYKIHLGDCVEVLRNLPEQSVNTCVTSPPYFGLRDYGAAGQIGLEETPDEYVTKLVSVFREVKRVLKDDGTLFINLGDCFKGNVTNTRFLNARHAIAYDTSDKALGDYQANDCLCENLCDVCRVVYQNRKSHKDGLLVAMLTASLSAPIHEHKVSEIDRFPTSDFVHQVNRTSYATQDQVNFSCHVGAQIHASLVSMLGESAPKLLALCLERASRGDVCLLCARSLPYYVHLSARMSVGLEGQVLHSLDNVPHDDQRMHRSQCKDMVCGCCNDIESYQYYTTESRYGKLKPKDLIGIPWMVAFALRADGWYLRSDIIWSKPNAMPESVTDRPTKAHEYIFMLSKSQHYYYDADAISEPAIYAGDNRGARTDNRRGTMCNSMSGVTGDKRNKRSVWSVTTKPYREAHFATYPPDLILPCVLAGCPEGGTVLDPFNGSGTTGQVALENNRNYVGIELNPDYIEMAERRLSKVTQKPSFLFSETAEKPEQFDYVSMFQENT